MPNDASTEDGPDCDVLIFFCTPTEKDELRLAAEASNIRFVEKSGGPAGAYYSLGFVGTNRVNAVETRMGQTLMTEFEAFISGTKGQSDDPPLVRLLRQKKADPDFGDAKLEVRRSRTALGFDPALIYLHFFAEDGRELGYQQELWDDDLNDALLKEHVRATNEPNEITRFGLRLNVGFEKAEERFGDGFFSSVLTEYIKGSPFAREPAIQDMLGYTATNRPNTGGNGFDLCREMIATAFHRIWTELTEALGYDPDAAQRVVVGALAYYLDERFSVTNRRRLGWA
jgi:hypothetical protein